VCGSLLGISETSSGQLHVTDDMIKTY